MLCALRPLHAPWCTPPCVALRASWCAPPFWFRPASAAHHRLQNRPSPDLEPARVTLEPGPGDAEPDRPPRVLARPAADRRVRCGSKEAAGERHDKARPPQSGGRAGGAAERGAAWPSPGPALSRPQPHHLLHVGVTRGALSRPLLYIHLLSRTLLCLKPHAEVPCASGRDPGPLACVLGPRP